MQTRIHPLHDSLRAARQPVLRSVGGLMLAALMLCALTACGHYGPPKRTGERATAAQPLTIESGQTDEECEDESAPTTP